MPVNDYYDSTGAPSTSSTISSATLRAEFDAIETGFTAVQAALGLKATSLLTGYTSAAGTVAATDTILQAIQKLNGNDATNANLTGPVTSVGNATAIADNALSIAKTSGLQAALDAKSPLASPTFTGTVTLPTPFTLGAVSVLPTGTELNFVDGVTSNIQTQLNAKAPLASPTFTGTVTIPTLVGTDTTDATSPTAAAFKTAGGLGVAKDCMFGKNVYQTSSAVGSVVYHEIRNTATSDASFAIQSIEVDSGSIADPMTNYRITGAAAYTNGIANADSDRFWINVGGAPGLGGGMSITSVGDVSLVAALGSTALSITSAGVVELPNGATFNGGVSAPGGIWYGATNGLQMRGATGSAYDFGLFNAAGSVFMFRNPTGTAHLEIGGSFGRGAPVTKTADFTVAATENWLSNNKAGSTCTVTLPDAATYPGREIMINNYQAFTVVSASSNVVDITNAGPTTAILPATAGKWVTLVSNGTNWKILQSN